MQWVILTLFFSGMAFANLDIPQDVNELADKLGVEGLDTSGLNVDNAQKVFKEKCSKLGGEEAYEKANEAKEKLMECVKAQVNVTVLQEEMENAKPTGDLDTVFGKYCKKTPVVLECMKDFTTALDPCLEEKEKESKTMVLNITESLVNFLCHKDGDRIAMFIAEGGLECMTEKQDAVQACANATFGKKIPTDVPSIDDLPLLVIKQEQCDDLTKLQECIVTELEKCKEPTPANIMESLFKFIRRVTPCANMDKAGHAVANSRESASTASSIVGSVVLIIGAMLVKLG